MKKFFEEIKTTRGIATILVVLGHSFPDSDMRIFNNNMFWKYVEQFIYSFHMPLFMMISGFVSSRLLELNTINDKFQYSKKRFLKLIIPYIVLSIPALILKYIFSGDAHNKYDFSNAFFNILSGNSPYSGSWFLYTLFFITIIILLLNKVRPEILLFASIALYFIAPTIETVSIFPELRYHLQNILSKFCLYNIFRCFFFYCLGLTINKHYEKIKSSIKSPVTLVAGVVLLILLNILNFNPAALNPILSYSLTFICSVAGIMSSLSLGMLLLKHEKINGLIGKVSDFSYDIYLISWFVQVPIRVVLHTKLHLNYEFVMINMLVWGLVIPYFISKYIVRKIGFLNFAVLGNYKSREAKG